MAICYRLREAITAAQISLQFGKGDKAIPKQFLKYMPGLCPSTSS